MNSVFELLMCIEKNRKIYIGEGDLIALKHFLDGYCMCAQQNGLEYGEDALRGFDTFVHDKCGDRRTVSLFECIAGHAENNEAAFERFFELLHRYMENGSTK